MRPAAAAVACAGALLLSALSAAVYLGRDSGRIRQGVTVAGTAVGGLDREEALARLEEALAPWPETRILLCEEGSLVAQVTCGEIGARLDLEGAVEQAWQVGREGGAFSAALARSWADAFPPAEERISPAVRIDRQILNRRLPVVPSSAWYDKATGQVMEGSVGLLLDAAELEAALEGVEPGGVLVFAVETVLQEITADQLRQALFRDVLGTYATQVGGSAARRNNVALSAAAVDGLVLNAGEIFDFNAAVGERTEERGYAPAPAFENGETVDSVGGGICQTSSTLYAAAMAANLEIVERSPHGYAVDYVPLGMDATVSWGGPEFRFRNDTGYPLRLLAAVEDGRLTVTIEGTRLQDLRVEITGEILSRQEGQTVLEETDSLPPGQRQVKQTGHTGYTVQTYRNVYDGEGNLLLRLPEACSVYRSRDKIVLVGKALPDGEESA